MEKNLTLKECYVLRWQAQKSESANSLLKTYAPRGCPMLIFVKLYMRMQFVWYAEKNYEDKRTKLVSDITCWLVVSIEKSSTYMLVLARRSSCAGATHSGHWESRYQDLHTSDVRAVWWNVIQGTRIPCGRDTEGHVVHQHMARHTNAVRCEKWSRVEFEVKVLG